ncbi:hypothetical protein SUGI_0199790 [Cryptomeria japonica]|uniref:accelerated cell death 11 n=1 Tax=Cryptomeria japonica TaxID=3369 RepID=UPI0024089E52|nr:accelerated cell death 11 [Cryptomeria japonica]GLJ12882.1 hypothetical protein SUGI_0199790 [Cryptomeria japonica]
MGIDKVQVQGQDNVEKALHTIGDVFDKLSSIVSDNDLKVLQFVEAVSTLSKLYGCLGVAFKFAEIDSNAKLRDLRDASQSFETFQGLLDRDVKRKSVRKAGSHSRNLLRLKQGIEFVKVLFEQILSTEENSLKDSASIAYSQVLAPSHGWAVRKAVAAGLYAVPTRAQLFKNLNEDEESARALMHRFIVSSTPVIEYINRLFLDRNIGIDW